MPIDDIIPTWDGQMPSNDNYDTRRVSPHLPLEAGALWNWFPEVGDANFGTHRLTVILPATATDPMRRKYVNGSVRISPKTGEAWMRIRGKDGRIAHDDKYASLYFAKCAMEAEAMTLLAEFAMKPPMPHVAPPVPPKATLPPLASSPVGNQRVFRQGVATPQAPVQNDAEQVAAKVAQYETASKSGNYEVVEAIEAEAENDPGLLAGLKQYNAALDSMDDVRHAVIESLGVGGSVGVPFFPKD